jgi:hypothetical protein
MINLKGFSTTVMFVVAFLAAINISYASDQQPQLTQGVKALPEAPILPDVRMFQRTHPEKIVFGQMKLAGTQPDIDSFAKASPFVINAQEIDKSAMIFSEYNRIGNSFNLHDPNAPIIVHTGVRIDEYSSLQNLIVLDEFDETSFFRFGYYGHNVGIVPQSIEAFRHLQLSKQSAERFFRVLGSDRNVMAEFIILPFYADAKEPLNIGGKDYMLMATRIAEFRLWTSDDPKEAQLLWFYRSPNYTPTDDEDINDLFRETVTR